MAPAAQVFHKHIEKLLAERDLSPHDVKAALAHGGHMARSKTTSHSAKAAAMGLHYPSQLMPEADALKAKAQRNAYYAAERAARALAREQTRASSHAKK